MSQKTHHVIYNGEHKLGQRSGKQFRKEMWDLEGDAMRLDYILACTTSSHKISIPFWIIIIIALKKIIEMN